MKMSKEEKKDAGAPEVNIAPCYCQHCRDLRAVAGKPAQVKIEQKVPATMYVHNVTTPDNGQQLNVMVSESEAVEAIGALEDLVHELRKKFAMPPPKSPDPARGCEYPVSPP